MSKVVNDNYVPSQKLSDDELKAKFLNDAAMPSIASQAAVSNVPTEIIQLPSKGYFYPEDHPLANGTIEMKYMTAKEEDILSSQSLIKQGVVIDKLLQSLIVTKVKYDEILTMDKNAIFLAARVLAYGKDYEVEITCPSCGVKSTHNIDLQQFDAKQVDWSRFTKGETTHKFTLPIGKQELTLKFLTHGDERMIEEHLKNAKKLSKITGVETDLTTRLKHVIVAVDGDDNKVNIGKFVDNMLSRDSLALRNYLKETTPDIDTTFIFTCPSCGHEQDNMSLPIGVNFFWPGV
jgi:hypothetical protein